MSDNAHINRSQGGETMAADSPIPERPQETDTTIRAFKQRRNRQRAGDLLAFVGMGGTLAFAVSGKQPGVPVMDLLFPVMAVFFGMLFGALVFTQVNWRCPACNKSLAGPRARIDSFFTPEPLNCPHCGTRLL
jgi:hypothetical protein